MTPAQRWGAAYTRALRRSGMTEAELAAKAGVAQVTLWTWRKGQKLANLYHGYWVAQALGDESLATLLRRLRTRECEKCGASFIAIRSPDARYCARSNCRAFQRQTTRLDRQRSGRQEVQRSATVSLRLIEADVAAFCWECEPEGLCRTATCPLRRSSPLPLADERLRLVG